MRRTKGHLAVAAALLDDPWGRHYGYALMCAADVKSGVLYPALSRFEQAGLLNSTWEPTDGRMGRMGRPPRRYYTLTDRGRAELGALIADTEES